jgi:tetratricopeptide (TPR) repeat protein
MAKLVEILDDGRAKPVPPPRWGDADDELEAVADLWDWQTRADDEPGETGLVRRYIRKGNLRKARDLLDALPPMNAALANLSGVVHELDAEYDLALQCYRLAVRLDPSLCAAAFNIARLMNTDTRENRICL